ncbi:MAG: hypothetical protein ACI8UO_004310, partial [Verrucomicrobiales bacterium]
MKQLSLLLLATLMAAGSLFSAEMRTWTDNKGTKMTAEMIKIDLGAAKVHLKQENGKTIEFPIGLLSVADRGYLRENMPINPSTAPFEIDKMVFEKLKVANAEIKAAKETLKTNTKLSREDKLKEWDLLTFKETMTYPTPATDDARFLRRVYLDIAGRIPTYDEATTFLASSNPKKREQLIDQLLDSDAFVSHFFNYMSDLLRIRDGISMGGFANLKGAAYAEWVKDQIRGDLKWDDFVTEVLAAEGYFWENPATGYLLTDFGMELCNLSNTFTIFAGTEITCAQCHDHPFEEIYQMDFYKMAAFFGKLQYELPDAKVMTMLGTKRKEFDAAAKKAEKNIGSLANIFDSYRLRMGEAGEYKTELPFDYKYDDADPLQKISPSTYFGDIMDVERHSSPRAAFATWLTSKDNPRFTINIANRLWKHVFGLGQVEPVFNVPGHLDGQAQNYELLIFLELLMKEVDYDVKDFLRILYRSQTYQRESCHHSPTLGMIDKGEFHFPAPVLRRMSAEQMWDSLVAMAVPNPEEQQVRVLDGYREIMSTDWSALNYQQAMEVSGRYDNLGRGGMMAPPNRRNRNQQAAPTRRASEMGLPARNGSFLFTFGQSDKAFIENYSKVGTIPQVMLLLNGQVTNAVMTSKDRAIVQVAAQARGKNDGIDRCFLSVLSRRATAIERDYAKDLVRG